MPPADPNDVVLFRDSQYIPDHYWQDLATQDPFAIARKALVVYQPGEGYKIPFLNRTYRCRPENNQLQQENDPGKPLNFQECLVLLMYLLRAQESPLEGKKVSERELPGGELFFRGPHALSKEDLEKKFRRDPQGFLQAGLGLGGQESGQGEASFELRILPRILVEYILYVEDDEFPAQVTITFDRSISRHLPLDVIWAMINITSRRLSTFSKDS